MWAIREMHQILPNNFYSSGNMRFSFVITSKSVDGSNSSFTAILKINDSRKVNQVRIGLLRYSLINHVMKVHQPRVIYLKN
ncbi:hypothetical protein CGH00_23870, partial [Vibrio parahaemolyticus]